MGRADDPAEAHADRFATALSTDLFSSTAPPTRMSEPNQDPKLGTRIRASAPTSDALPLRSSTEAPARVHRSAATSPAHDRAGGSTVAPELNSRIRAAAHGGTRLAPNVQAAAEQRSGSDLDRVRIHTGLEVDDLNRSLQATAFTVGSDIYLGRDAGEPGSLAGTQVLAHELGHVVQSSGADRVHRWFGESKTKKGAPVMGASGTLEQSNGLSKADKAEQRAGFARGAAAQKQLQKDIKPLESALKKLVKHHQAGNAADYSAAYLLRDNAQRMIDMMPGPSTRGAQKVLGAAYPDERKRLRYIVNEAQLIYDEYLVSMTKKKAQNIYLDAGKQAGGSEGLSKLSAGAQASGLFGQPASDLGKEVSATGSALGLSAAEIAAIYTFTADDYKYINPATANSESWMKNANPDLIDKPDLTPEERAKLNQSFAATSEQDQKAARRVDLKTRKEEGSLHAGVASMGLAKMEVWAGPVFRGEVLTQADFDKRFETVAPKKKYRSKEKTFTRSTISSSSKQQAIAKNFWFIAGPKVADPKVNILWEIQLTNGRDISKLSDNPYEDEVATLAGATFSIDSVTWEGTDGDSFFRVRCRQKK